MLLVACGGKDEPKRPAQNVTVTVGGKSLAIDRAFIRRASPDVYTVLAGAGKGSCESLHAGTNDGKGQAFAFTVTKRVSGVGHERHVITDLWSRDFEASAKDIPVKLEGTADPGTTTTIAFSSPIQSTAFSASGTLTAVGCGETPPTGAGVPKVTHPSKGTILVASKKLTVRGVTVKVRSGAAAADLPNIVISTVPRDCSGVALPAPLVLERTDGKWTLSGTWLEKPIPAIEPTELTFSANMAGKSPDGPTLNLQLSGKGTFGDYVVELFGTAEAIECI